METYNVVLQGLQPNVDAAKAKQNLTALFKTTPEHLDRLLAQRGYVIKRGVEPALAAKYKKAIELAGGQCIAEREMLAASTLDFAVNASAQSSERKPTTPDTTQPSRTAPASTARAREADIAAFVGKKYDYYAKKWTALDGGSKISWNWAAVLGNYAWLSYRKMYRHAAALVAVLIAETIIEATLNVPGISSTINFLNLGLFIGVGLSGNRWYRSHVEKKVQAIRSSVSAEQAAAELLKRGGTSMGAAIGVSVVLLLGFSLSAALAA